MPKLTKKTQTAFFTPPPRVVKGWNLYVWQWFFEADLPLTSKNSQLLQNRHFTDFFLGGGSKNVFDEIFCRKFFLWRRKMKCRGSSETRFPKVSGQTEPSSGGKRIFKVCKKCEKKFVSGIEKWNVGNRLKRVLAKFQADRSHVWGVDGRSKFPKFFEIREI